MLEHFDKNNLHHAYLIEGERSEVLSQLTSYLESINISTSKNPDFCNMSIDSFKMEEALNLRKMAQERPMGREKKFFLISVNSMTLDAQQTLLKIFEEPTENTHFFVVVPEIGALLPTLISRFYKIKLPQEGNRMEAEKFLSLTPAKRIDFLKDFLEENDEDSPQSDSSRARALKFLNELEFVLHKSLVSKAAFDTGF